MRNHLFQVQPSAKELAALLSRFRLSAIADGDFQSENPAMTGAQRLNGVGSRAIIHYAVFLGEEHLTHDYVGRVISET